MDGRKPPARGEHGDKRYAEHYGPYGQHCINTGQFDAGECWKCEIKRLREERDTLAADLHNERNTAEG